MSGIRVTRENQITCRKACPDATLCITNLTWPSLRLNPGLCYKMSVTECLSHGMAHSSHLLLIGQTDLT
jgi:hypothetical protein